MSDERGFTLVELLVAMILMVIVLGAVLTTFDTFNGRSQNVARRNDAQEAARRAMGQVTRELRNAVSATGVSAPVGDAVERAVPNDLVFQTISPAGPSGTNTRGRQRVRYCLDSSTSDAKLYRQVLRSSSALPLLDPAATACPGPGAAWTQTQVVAQNVTNRRSTPARDLFTYRFGTSGSTALNDLVAVTAEIYLDMNSGTLSPAETELRSGVNLRNANQPPVALFTTTQQGARLVLNASSAFDPERQPMTYKWYVDGVLQPVQDVRVETGALSFATHAIRLVVTDSAGVSAETTQSIGVTP